MYWYQICEPISDCESPRAEIQSVECPPFRPHHPHRVAASTGPRSGERGMGRVALLGIAQRTVSVKRPVNSTKQNRVKVLESDVKKVGDLIAIKRMTKNITPGHIAQKMGIAASVICSWEDGTTTPNDWQMELLAEILGFDAKEFQPYIN